MYLVTTGHLTESASCISKQAMPMHWQICVHSSPGRGLCLYNSTYKKENIYKHYSFKLLLAELPVATYKIFTNLWLDFTYGSQFSKLQLYLWAHRKKNLPLESVIFKYLNSPLTTAVPSQWSRFWFRNCAEKDSKVTILHLKDNIYIKIRNKKGTQKRFLLSRTQIFWDWIALSKHRRLFCYTSPPLSQ